MQLNRKLALTGAICLVAIAVIVVLVLPEHVSGVARAKPPDVEVAEVEQKDVALYSEWIGTLEGYVNADVRAQVTGYLLRQDCKEGAPVRKGSCCSKSIRDHFERLWIRHRGNWRRPERSSPMPKPSNAG